MKKIPEVGTFYKVSLGDNKNVFARLIFDYLFSFYKIEQGEKNNEEVMQLMVEATPIFSVYVNNEVFTRSNWEIIGHKPLEERILNNMPVFFRQDIGDKQKCVLVNTVPGYQKPISPQECVNMEPSVIWGAVSIEDRLRDYLENRPNKRVEFYKVKL